MKIKIFVMTLLITIVLMTASVVSACTGFNASEEDNVLVGINFDWSRNFDVYMNVYPEAEGKYGRIIFDIWWPWFGFDYTLPIQGMNDQGLFVDTYITPSHTVDYSGNPFFESGDPEYYNFSLWAYCLAKCSTISEVLDVYLNQYDQFWPDGISQGQVMFVDSNGDSIIIEDYDTIIFKGGNFQVVTNFLQSQPELGGYPCWRYDTAVSMLENMTELSVDYFSEICDATNLPTTIYSNVYDLILEKMYIYYNNDYTKYLEIDLNEELANGASRVLLGTLFDFEENEPPYKSEIPDGPTTGVPEIYYLYKCNRTSDPDGDRVMYLFDWGDESDSGWIYTASNIVEAEHKWNDTGKYQVRFKSMDIYGRESEWSDSLLVNIPRPRSVHHPFLYRLFERFPNIFPIIRYLLGFD
ncbi:MAG: hypothetical protein JSU91_00395 [Thermoplasmatales archaeon]|nr:MAG: hypothetical protein JSU91_00395 [Thermoplasmatales archaeon]